jgi:hypothetical protein
MRQSSEAAIYGWGVFVTAKRKKRKNAGANFEAIIFCPNPTFFV